MIKGHHKTHASFLEEQLFLTDQHVCNLDQDIDSISSALRELRNLVSSQQRDIEVLKAAHLFDVKEIKRLKDLYEDQTWTEASPQCEPPAPCFVHITKPPVYLRECEPPTFVFTTRKRLRVEGE